MKVLELKKVVKIYDSSEVHVQAVNDVSLDFSEAEFAAIVGPSGSGKTTLAGLLAKHYGWTPNYEDIDDNPYLNDFYEDMQRWSFNLQIYFLNSRFRQILEIRKSSETIVQDRTIYEDAYIFARALHHRIVAVVDGLHSQPPDALPREHGLDDGRTAEQICHLQADEGHHGHVQPARTR